MPDDAKPLSPEELDALELRGKDPDQIIEDPVKRMESKAKELASRIEDEKDRRIRELEETVRDRERQVTHALEQGENLLIAMRQERDELQRQLDEARKAISAFLERQVTTLHRLNCEWRFSKACNCGWAELETELRRIAGERNA